MSYEDLLHHADDSVAKMKNTVNKDYWRLQYHLMPQAYWMNDPNGFVTYQGEHHLFYQHHPYSPQWGPMHWGHAVSQDMVHWRHLPIALAPSEPYDKDGCFSGSAIQVDDKLYVLYTGNVSNVESGARDFKQVQALAVSVDGVTFQKVTGNPVIPAPPVGDFDRVHFRDPKVWQHGDDFYCVVGSKTISDQGQALLYQSRDLYSWQFVNVLAKSYGDLGHMWECPDFFRLGDKYVLVISPQGAKSSDGASVVPHQSGYVMGDFEYFTGKLNHGKFHLLDEGFDFYAPQTTLDKKGRRVVVAWMDMWGSGFPTQGSRWVGAITIPRVLIPRNGEIYSVPLPELEELRYDEVSYENVYVDGVLELSRVNGDCLELELLVNPIKATTFTVALRCDNLGLERTTIQYMRKDETLSFCRDHSGGAVQGVKITRVPVIDDELLKLRIFLDRSSIEIFVNDGQKVITSRIYPKPDSTGIQFLSDGKAVLERVTAWKLHRA